MISDLNIGAKCPTAGSLSILVVEHTGNASNNAGQLVTYTLIKNVAAGGTIMAAITGLATTAGVHAGSMTSFVTATYAVGDKLSLQLSYSAPLSVPLADVMGGAA